MTAKFFGCTIILTAMVMSEPTLASKKDPVRKIVASPLISDVYTADPSAHVFENKLYLYPSHDWDSGVIESKDGNKFAMKDYHVYSTDSASDAFVDHGKVLDLLDIPWAKRQLWAPDAAEKNGRYYLYFPAKDEDEIFRIGVAISDKPSGPFKAEANPMKGAYSIDPAVFKDDDGSYYMYAGGIWGGQLQRWKNGVYTGKDSYPKEGQPAILPRVAKLSKDMISLAEDFQEVMIIDQQRKLLTTEQTDKRFFEAAWMHKFQGKYYLSWSTGDTHNIAYGIGTSPYGPFVYQGIILEEVLGWTNHHSIVEFQNKWYLFFHDSSQSNGETHLRSVKMTELFYNNDGTIQRMNAMVK